jgi:hypothetical protein
MVGKKSRPEAAGDLFDLLAGFFELGWEGLKHVGLVPHGGRLPF